MAVRGSADRFSLVECRPGSGGPAQEAVTFVAMMSSAERTHVVTRCRAIRKRVSMIEVAKIGRDHAPGCLARSVQEAQRDLEDVWCQSADVLVGQDVIGDRIHHDPMPERR